MVNHLKQLDADYRKKGFVLLGVGIASRDSIDKQKAKLAQLDCSGVGIHLFDASGQVATQYQVRGIPHLVLIGRDGMTVSGHANIGQVKNYVAQNCTKEEPEAGSIEAPKTDSEVKRRMAEKGRPMNFEGTPLKDALKMISESTGIPIELDGTDTADEEVTMALADGSLEDQLKLLAAMHGLEITVKNKGITLAKPAEPEVVEPQFKKGTPEYDLYMEMLKLVVSRSHQALKADSVTDSIDKLSSRDRDKMERMVRYQLERADGSDAELLRAFRDLVK